MTLAEELAKKYEFRHGDYALGDIRGRIEGAVDEAIQLERERCCKAVCADCRVGYPLWGKSNDRHMHDGSAVPCAASPIRRKE